MSELCDALEIPRPDPSKADEAENIYVFEKAVTFQNGDGTTSTGRIDLYRQDCVVLEARQGSEKADGLGLNGKARKLKTGTANRGTQG